MTAPRVIACCTGMVNFTGLERMAFEVFRALIERGASVHCVLNPWKNERIAAACRELGIPYSTGYHMAVFDRHTRDPRKLAHMGWDIFRNSAGLAVDTARFRPTHVFLPDFHATLRNWPALLALRQLGTRVVLRLGNAPDTSPFYRRLWRSYIDPCVDRYVGNSQFTLSQLLQTGIAADKADYIYNTVPMRTGVVAPLPASRAARILYVGQIIPDKGVDLAIDAVEKLVAENFDVELDIVGAMDGWVAPAYRGYRERLRTSVHERGLNPRVHFLGFREDVAALYDRASIHVVPSRPEIREGFGVVVAEAKQHGLPSVVCRSGALPELVTHGEDGWVAEPTAAAIAEGLRYFLSDPARLERGRAAARLSSAYFSRERFAEAWWRVFTR